METLKINSALADGQSLEEELARVVAEVKRQPGKAGLRVYLFQLLCVLGNWQRALQQLQVSAQLDAAALPMAQTYREAIRCESMRAEVFAGKRAPHFLGQPPAWGGLLVESLRLLADGKADAADGLRAEAFDLAEETACHIDGEARAWVADADSRLGPMCEIIVNGLYYWLPYSQIRSLNVDAPEDLRDCVWAPCQLVLANGGEHVALMPARYPGSEAAPDDRIKLGRLTEWRAIGADAWAGLGQRMLISDAGDHPLFTIGKIAVAA